MALNFDKIAAAVSEHREVQDPFGLGLVLRVFPANRQVYLDWKQGRDSEAQGKLFGSVAASATKAALKTQGNRRRKGGAVQGLDKAVDEAMATSSFGVADKGAEREGYARHLFEFVSGLKDTFENRLDLISTRVYMDTPDGGRAERFLPPHGLKCNSCGEFYGVFWRDGDPTPNWPSTGQPNCPSCGADDRQVHYMPGGGGSVPDALFNWIKEECGDLSAFGIQGAEKALGTEPAGNTEFGSPSQRAKEKDTSGPSGSGSAGGSDAGPAATSGSQV